MRKTILRRKEFSSEIVSPISPGFISPLRYNVINTPRSLPVLCQDPDTECLLSGRPIAKDSYTLRCPVNSVRPDTMSRSCGVALEGRLWRLFHKLLDML